MENELNIGDDAETIDDNIKGKIVSVSDDEVILLTEDGFEMSFKPNEIIKTPPEAIHIYTEELKKVLIEELQPKKKYVPKKSSSIYKLEVDLHIHELIDDARNLSNYEILNIQMAHAKKRLEWAIQKRLKSAIFIHGVGEGVLKAELQTLFRRYDNIEYFDADYQTYGVGATEVKIY
jgi:dsDNA-specific endonuclease/ATPase MutS2